MSQELRINFKKKFSSLIILFVVAFIFIFIPSVYAQDSVMRNTGGASYDSCNRCQSTSPECKQYCGSYQLNDAMLVVKRVSDIILAVVGSLALLAFVIGGVMFLVSGGNQNMISRGKATIVGAVIGLFIVFFSYTIIYFITKDALKIPDDPFSAGTSLGVNILS